MVLKIYGNWFSPYMYNVLVVLKELGIEYKVIEVKFETGEHKSPEFVAKNPWGRLPVLDDDGFLVYESRAISRYIVAKYGERKPELELVPKGLKENAIFEQAMSVESSYFDPNVYGLTHSLFYTKTFFNLEVDQVRAAESTKKLEDTLKTYNEILSKQDYIGGNKFTIADISHLGYGWIVTASEQHGIGFEGLVSSDFPHVNRWWKEITSRKSWKDVLAEVENSRSG